MQQAREQIEKKIYDLKAYVKVGEDRISEHQIKLTAETKYQKERIVLIEQYEKLLQLIDNQSKVQ